MKHKKFKEVYAYTYLVTRKSDGAKYHGVRYANLRSNITPHGDLGIHYFTSSKEIKKDFKSNPDKYEFRVAWTFDTVDEAIEHEYRVNSKIFTRKDWINKSYGKNFGEHPDIGKLISESKTPEVMKRTKDSFRQFLETEEGKIYKENLTSRKKEFWASKTKEEKLAILRNAHNSHKQKQILKNLQEMRKKVIDPSSGKTLGNLIAEKSAQTRKANNIDSTIGTKRNEAYNKKLVNMSDEEFEDWCKGKTQRAISGAKTRRHKYK